MATIITPRPPLNLFESIRRNIDSTPQTVYDVPFYIIPAEGPTPQRTIGAAAIMTGALFTPLNQSVDIFMSVLGPNDEEYPLISGVRAPAGEFLSVVLDRQVLLSGERLQVRTNPDQEAILHFSFILNQREEFEVVS